MQLVKLSSAPQHDTSTARHISRGLGRRLNPTLPPGLYLPLEVSDPHLWRWYRGPLLEYTHHGLDRVRQWPIA